MPFTNGIAYRELGDARPIKLFGAYRPGFRGLNFQPWPEILKRTVCDVVCMQIPPFSPVPFEKGTDVGGGEGEEIPLPSGASATTDIARSRVQKGHTCAFRDETVYRSCILMVRYERSILVPSKYSMSLPHAARHHCRYYSAYTYIFPYARICKCTNIKWALLRWSILIAFFTIQFCSK